MAELLTEILQLPKTERWALAMKILDSIRSEESDITEEQWEELEHRIKAIESGTVKPLSEKAFWAGLNRKKA